MTYYRGNRKEERVTPNEFRRLALALPGAVEASHGGHPDFRAGRSKRIFATLGYPDDAWAMIKLSPDQQALLLATQPELFKPVKGAWGESGSTNVRLDVADAASIRNALRLAWEAVSSVSSSKVSPSQRKSSSARKEAIKRSSPALDWESVVTHALSFKGTELATHYGRPAVKVNGRAMLSVGRKEGSFALHIDLETKQLLIETNPLTYWQTTHYEGWPTVLVRYDSTEQEHVLAMVKRAWQQAQSLGPPRSRYSRSATNKRRKGFL
jgi:hypothetical protein